MTRTKYAFGLHEKGADENLWVTFSAEDNHTAYSAVAQSLSYRYGDDFEIAGILLDLKYSDGIEDLAVTPETPASDHTFHIYDADDVAVTLYDDYFTPLHTFDLYQWVARYGFTAH